MKKRAKTSYPWQLTLLLAALCGISLTLVMLHQASTVQPAPVKKLMKWSQVDDALQDTGSVLQQIQEEIDQGNVLQADWRYTMTLLPLWQHAATQYPGQLWEDIPITDFFNQMEEEHLSAIRSGFSNTLHRMAAGDVSPNELQEWLDEKNDQNLFDQLTASEAWVIAERQKQATNWYRILFQNPAKNWVSDQKVKEILTASNPPEGTQKVVWGPALSTEEQENTAGTLMITGMVQTAEFKAETPDGFGSQEWSPAPLPLGVSLYPVEMETGISSRWAEVKPIFIWRPPPPSISKNLESEIQLQYKATLRRDLWAALNKWRNQVSKRPSTP